MNIVLDIPGMSQRPGQTVLSVDGFLREGVPGPCRRFCHGNLDFHELLVSRSQSAESMRVHAFAEAFGRISVFFYVKVNSDPAIDSPSGNPDPRTSDGGFCSMLLHFSHSVQMDVSAH